VELLSLLEEVAEILKSSSIFLCFFGKSLRCFTTLKLDKDK